MAKTVSGAVTAALLVLLLLLFLRGGLIGAPGPALAAQGAAVLLMVWARLTMGRRSFHFTANPTQDTLVVTGPYRFVRHPIYASAALFTWAGVLSHRSAIDVAIGVLVKAGLIVRAVLEDELLRARYPGYEAYARATSRLIPFVF